MRHSIAFLAFQLFGFLAFGQIAHWESYFQPARAQHHLEEETRLWLPTDVGLLEVNKETGAYTLWNKGHGGLSSNSIEAVARHPITRELFIGTYDVALMVRETPGNDWQALPFPEEWGHSLFQPIQIYCMKFDLEGVLWIGTSRGLARYDGESWELYNQESGHEFLSWVKDIEVSPDGGVYLASNVVYHVKDGVFIPLSTPDFQSEDFLFSYGDAAMHYQSDGSLWFFTDIGRAGRYQDGEWEVFEGIDSLIFFPEPPQFVTESPAGELIAYFGNGHWYKYAEEGWQAISAPQGLEQPLYFTFTETGYVSVSGEEASISTTAGIQNIPFPEYPFSGQPYSFHNSPDGQLWVRDGNTLRSLDSEQSVSLEEEGAPLFFSSYAFDAQGRLWATQNGAVFQRTDQEGWKRYGHTNSILPDATNSWRLKIGPDNTVWLSIYNQGLYSFRNGEWEQRVHPILAAYNIDEMTPLPDGRLFLQLWGLGDGSRLAYLDGQNIELFDDGEQGYRQANWQRLSYDPVTGLVWALDWGGLQQFDGQSWEQVAFPYEQIAGVNQGFRSFSVRGGRIMAAGTYRIFIREDEQWFAYSPDNAPLANEAIREVGLGRNGALWVTHQQGTSFIDKGQLSPASASENRNKPVKQVGVFPNPAGETVFLDGVPGSGRGVVCLFNARGQQVAVISAVFHEGAPAELSIPKLAPGWYAGRVHLNEEVFIFKLLKVG